MKPSDLELDFPTDIPDWRPREVSAEVWLAEQRQVMAEYAARYSPEERLAEWMRMHSGDEPFVM